MSELPILCQAISYGASVAFKSEAGEQSYAYLLARSKAIALALLRDQSDLNEAHVAMLLPAGAEYAATQWAIWRAGGVMLPLCLSATEAEWEYALIDSGAGSLVTDSSLVDKLGALCRRLGIAMIVSDDIMSSTEKSLPTVDVQRRAMILYTSGTTNKPKGVVTTHSNIQAQIESLVKAWEWQSTDRIPLFLPLHHIHGIINVMSCALWSGASIEPFSRFDLASVVDRVRAHAYSLFMAVPTIYVKLIEVLHESNEQDRMSIVDGFRSMRLMVSGSAALLPSVHEEWFQLTGQKLLERYGMTEIGMALSNPYHGERRPGAVGQPLPGVEVRLKSESGTLIDTEGQPGEIQVRGPAVFSEYWNRPETTNETFDDGWFRTGDMAVIERGYYRIMGRLSVDIIKSGGYKLSALEIEDALLVHPTIRECAVVGILDSTWGEAVAAAVVLKGAGSLELAELRDWCKERLSVYKIPKRLLVLSNLPRNAMGKVTKSSLRKLFSE